jgi:hypothetical protein
MKTEHSVVKNSYKIDSRILIRLHIGSSGNVSAFYSNVSDSNPD